MSNQPNWGLLVAQNRVKAQGIPWTPEEQKAIQEGIDPEDVRAGLLTKKAVENEDTKDEETGKKRKRVERMNLAELIALAEELEIQFDPEVVTKADLILEIKKKQASPSPDDGSEEDEESEE